MTTTDAAPTPETSGVSTVAMRFEVTQVPVADLHRATIRLEVNVERRSAP